jgi:hypothetical protein
MRGVGDKPAEARSKTRRRLSADAVNPEEDYHVGHHPIELGDARISGLPCRSGAPVRCSSQTSEWERSWPPTTRRAPLETARFAVGRILAGGPTESSLNAACYPLSLYRRERGCFLAPSLHPHQPAGRKSSHFFDSLAPRWEDTFPYTAARRITLLSQPPFCRCIFGLM